MIDAMRKVGHFHHIFGLPSLDKPQIPAVQRKQLRMRLIVEEVVEELLLAMEKDDLVEIADGIADAVYVIVGAALEYGIPAHLVFQEVHNSNMSKLWPGGEVRRREDGKILKPPTFTPPDIARVLDSVRHGWTLPPADVTGTVSSYERHLPNAGGRVGRIHRSE